ncbi:tetratricopeptide repeat protein [Phototrophicus methaneseepsis]|uniref:Tetratricopeptide repeat protein n=1 Tax=Phototrophicus methaneseepsis TaxID=2710758 RepID=A0A7S8E8Y7_9CHLR|nr:tetratricopeptide repeat protein [Phototrophicus methaneseepsis]QPC82566.1 tetratricopeptide repeat protein [Phototrophicus methaneseepsis]
MADFTPLEAPAHELHDLPLMHPGRPVGRDAVIKELYDTTRQNRPILLYGIPGSGKTALAAALAAAFIQQPGGVLWLDGNVPTFAALLVKVGRAYGLTEVVQSQKPTGFVGTVATTLMQHKPLVVIDNVRNAHIAEQFIEKCTGNLPVILISQDAMDGDWQPVQLEPLLDTDAVALFKQKAGINDNDSDVSIYSITKLLSYLPFPIVMAARAMAASKQDPAAYLETLRQVESKIEGNGAMAALTASYRALTGALQGLMLMLGATFRGEASAELLSMVSGAPQDAINQAMTVLSQLYLVEKFTVAGADFYRMHRLTYQFMQALLQGKNQLTTLQQKVRDAVLAYTRKYSTEERSYTKLAIEMDNILATAQWASEQGDRTTANALLEALTQADNFIQEAGYVYELLQLQGSGSGYTTAFPAYGPEPVIERDDEEDEEDSFDDDYLYDEEAEDEAYEDDEDADEEEDDYDDYDDEGFGDLDDEDEDEGDGEVDTILEDVMATPNPVMANTPDVLDVPSFDEMSTQMLTGVDLEQLRMALNAAKMQSDIQRQKQLLKAIGKVQVAQGRETEAITTYTELLDLLDSLEMDDVDDDGTLETLDMLSSLLVKTENAQAALMHTRRGIELAQELEDRMTEMHILRTQGAARQDLGESDAAIDAFSEALEIARMSDDRQNEALILYELGYAYLDNGDAERAIQTWRESRPLFRDQGKRDYEGRVLGGLGTAYAELERWSEAISDYKAALHIAREVNNKEEEMLQLSNLGQAQVQAGQLPDALLSYRQALHVAYQTADDDHVTSAVVDLVNLMMRSKRLMGIAKLLVQDGLEHDPNDRELAQLDRSIDSKLEEATAQGLQQAPVAGSARDYAANAYQLLDA